MLYVALVTKGLVPLLFEPHPLPHHHAQSSILAFGIILPQIDQYMTHIAFLVRLLMELIKLSLWLLLQASMQGVNIFLNIANIEDDTSPKVPIKV